jgi:hypothetical protein
MMKTALFERSILIGWGFYTLNRPSREKQSTLSGCFAYFLNICVDGALA